MHFPRFGGGGTAGGGTSSSSSSKAASGGSADESSKKDGALGNFDPGDLERGATALKEIDQSKHSEWAFELSRMQEKTTQLSHTRDEEKHRSARAEAEGHFSAIQGDEQRKTVSHTADQERHTSQYKAQIESGLQGRKLELQKDQLEYRLKRENEQFMQHEQLRLQNEAELEEVTRETIRAKAKFDREAALTSAEALAKGRAQQERENIEIRIREMRAQENESRRTRLEQIDAIFTEFGAGFQTLYEDQTKAVVLVGGLTVLALGVYGARTACRVAATIIEKRLSKPPLVRETSRWTWKPSSNWFSRGEQPSIFERIVLEEALTQRLQWTTNALVSAQENGTPFRHLLLHGAPGTGKTLFARTLARQSGLDYAVMSGGDLGPLGRDGPNELHKLFKWAQDSKKGLVLFVDEADAFLRRGRSGDGAMSEDARNALSVFLHHTGTENGKVAVILATNVPRSLDRAVLDRMDEAFEFPIPAYPQRVQMLQMFVGQYLSRPTRRGVLIEMDEQFNEDFLADVAQRTEGMSGRQLAKLVIAFQSAVFGSGTPRLTMGLAETVLQWRLANPNT